MMQAIKCLTFGLLIGMFVGASSNLVQSKVKELESACVNIKSNISNLEGQKIMNSVDEKIDSLKESFYEFKDSLSFEIKTKIENIINEIENLISNLKDKV